MARQRSFHIVAMVGKEIDMTSFAFNKEIWYFYDAETFSNLAEYSKCEISSK